MPTDINTTKTRLQRLLDSATAKEAPQKTSTASKLIPTLLIITTLGSMLPFQVATAFFSMSFATIASLSLILYSKHYLQISRKNQLITGALIATSVLSGCSPAFTFQTQPELIKFAHENKLQFHTISRIGVLGFGLDAATIAACQADSNIKTVVGAQIDRGHGLINVINITIAGKS
jgi:hypothetical protein